MPRLAFKMQLYRGFTEDYKRRHDKLWPELRTLLKSIGIKDYSIFLDEETFVLFAVLEIEDESLMNDLPKHEVMQKWWSYMKDIMETNEDNSPTSVPLKEVFYLP